MAGFFTTSVKAINEIWEKADPRVEDYPLMSTPWPSFIICFAYVYSVQVYLPKFMENRKPYDIKKLMIAYNFTMVALSGFLFMEFALSGWFAGYSFGCQPVDYSRTPQALRMVLACWCFYITKFIELLDTIFFVLRKKYNQVTFLHVFHHSIMPVSWWFGVKFVPGGFGTFHALLNSFIHFVMYTYYALAAMGPKYQKYLWWKRYMTSMQITQFVLICLHSAQLFFLECNYPVAFAYWIGSYAAIFLVLFSDFYRKAYRNVTGSDQRHKNGTVPSDNNVVGKNKLELDNGVAKADIAINGVKKVN